MNPSPIFYLAIATLLGGLAWGLWQLKRVRDARAAEDNEHGVRSS